MYDHNVVIIAPNDYPDFLKWLPGDESVLKFESQQKESKALIDKADLLFTLDFNAFHRAGDQMANVLEASDAIKVIMYKL
jgi:phosphoesterase RecJ-like protein